MTTHTHSPRTAPVVSPAPPYTRRQCAAIVRVLPPSGKIGRPEWREPITRRCLNTASPWLPECDYCATHVPADSLPIVEARAQLWHALLLDVWSEVLASYPYGDGCDQ